MFPEIAVREFVADALIHQDFAEGGASVMIEIFLRPQGDLEPWEALHCSGSAHRRVSVP